jgi:Adenylate and Guanylate cyclase catalytic domain
MRSNNISYTSIICLNDRRARFQLFGDTVNTAARMESTGATNKIHASSETGSRLIEAGKSHWVTPREAEVAIKGKGNMQTYWISLDNKLHDANSSTERSRSDCSSFHDGRDFVGGSENDPHQNLSQTCRLVHWNSDVLAGMLKAIVAHRQATSTTPDTEEKLIQHETSMHYPTSIPREEMAEVVKLPRYFDRGASLQSDPDNVILDSKVTNELFGFVNAIASMYKGKVPMHDHPVESWSQAAQCCFPLCQKQQIILSTISTMPAMLLRRQSSCCLESSRPTLSAMGTKLNMTKLFMIIRTALPPTPWSSLPAFLLR